VSLDLLQMAAGQLGPLVDEVAFVGGASLFLWIDDPGAPEPRATVDVDVIVVVDGHADYYRLSERLREQGFSEDDRSGVICRWRGARGLILDVMPTDERILGFSNRWYENALETAQDVYLPSGTRIRAVTPPYLLATKLEAFRSRGGGDYLASADFEDIVRLIDGREALLSEVEATRSDVRTFVAGELQTMLADVRFEAGVAGALLPDPASQGRLALILERVRRLAQPVA
jgi:hypothetical protein